MALPSSSDSDEADFWVFFIQHLTAKHSSVLEKIETCRSNSIYLQASFIDSTQELNSIYKYLYQF